MGLYIESMEDLVNLVLSARSIIDNEENRKARFEKGAADYVTLVDLKVENYLRDELAKRFPSYQFMGEEEDAGSLDFDRPLWILDPIDGTTNLTHLYPECAISLGLYADGEIQAGIVYNPFTGQLFTAEKGKGAFENGSPIHVSEAVTLNETLLEIGTAPYNKNLSPLLFDTVQKIFMEIQDIRRCGSAAMALCNVAKGISEGYFEPLLKPWDYAAGSLILTEAGGTIATMDGDPLSFHTPSAVLAAANEQLFSLLLPYMSGFPCPH